MAVSDDGRARWDMGSSSGIAYGGDKKQTNIGLSKDLLIKKNNVPLRTPTSVLTSYRVEDLEHLYTFFSYLLLSREQ